MDNAYLVASTWIGLALVASLITIRVGISVALVEIGLGVLAGNALGLSTTPWIDFLAAFGSVLVTFLAEAEIDPASPRRHVSVPRPVRAGRLADSRPATRTTPRC